MNKCDIIRNLIQITGNMRGHQNRMFFILCVLSENIQNLVPEYRIQTACRLIQNEKLRIVA